MDRLLLKTAVFGCAFNVLAVLTHPYILLLSAVHHLYRLRRGTTIAKFFEDRAINDYFHSNEGVLSNEI
ncbi:hypothetical protein KIN20_007885 [Parelaphostrongylus tenuis]|uniref:BCAS3 WD40 domain-containing protein n=1 Tax=Parelaphostrongylus tenuis TaxID=148309 RepID=A0AAD5MPP6_PARTN|nr:hypothetical protein KIN20_007885 [Parelaphostrongylus tenuis]